jgi:Na+-transporting NADH:ubiquinone oxidoreductase subunit C
VVASARATLRFAAVVSAVLGIVVAVTAAALAPRIARNVELERKRHVLAAIGEDVPRALLASRYQEIVRDDIVVLAGTPYPVHRVVDDHDRTRAYCVPIEGAGLWGPIRGYLALDADATRVLGVTFHEHRETPGLGAQIEDRSWTGRWVGKSIVDERGGLAQLRVVRGARPDDPHAVDAISGATITSRAVESLVQRGLERYRPFLEERWRRR